MSQSTFTFRVDAEIKDAFSKAAQDNDRTAAQLLRDFMRHYIREASTEEGWNEWFSSKIEAGQNDISTGKIISNDEVEKRAKERQARLLRGN